MYYVEENIKGLFTVKRTDTGEVVLDDIKFKMFAIQFKNLLTDAYDEGYNEGEKLGYDAGYAEGENTCDECY